MDINSKIKQLRQSKGWNKADLAKKLDLTPAAISSYEREFKPITPSIKVIYKLAELFKIGVDELIERPMGKEENNNIANIDEGTALKFFITENKMSETEMAKLAGINRNDFYYYYAKKLIPLSGWERLKKANIERDKVIDYHNNNFKQVIEQNEILFTAAPVYNLDFNSMPATLMPEEGALGYINFNVFKNCKAFVKITGKSMEPELRPGDMIGLEPQQDHKIIEYGNVFGIITKSSQHLIRIIRKGLNEEEIILKSFNSDYDDITINKSDIQSLFKVHGPIRSAWM